MSSGAWWSRSPAAARRLDAGICVAVATVGIGGQIAVTAGADLASMPLSFGGVLLACLAAGALWWRRTRPLVALCVGVAVLIVAGGWREPGLFAVEGGLVVVLGCFAAGAWSERWLPMIIVGAVMALGAFAGSLNDGAAVLSASAGALALVALPMVAGVAARSRRRYLEEVERRLAESERNQEERAQLAIQDERNRIARELHDVVAHHVSLIGVQAGAARASLGRSPDATRDALAAIEESSRTAVGEMRQIVDVLRPADERDDTRLPQPGVSELDDLFDRWRDAGYEIDACVEVSVALSPAVALTSYRIVEEALTNVARHSEARSAAVSVCCVDGAVQVRVEDPGPARPVSDGGGGRGLAGMRERVAVFGGSVSASATDGGGFAVRSTIPVGSEP